ncbi:MAG TPA: phage baseplate assembly protein V [Polyangiaceae bacterium]
MSTRPQTQQKCPPEPQHARYFGKYRGRVVSNRDPQHRGRLQVKVPQVLDEASTWAMPCVPYAGAGMGFFAMPEEGTGVWVEFEAGDPSFPIWVGCFWNKDDIPDSDPDKKFFKTKKFSLTIDDTVGEITIENDSGSKVTLTALDVQLKSSTVVAEATGGKKTELSARGFSVNDAAFEVL